MALDTKKPALQTVGKYDLFEMIAEGGMGTVYKARDTSNGQTVAIKIVPPQVAKNPVLMKRFEQEYSVASSLDHPNIVRALDFGSNGSTPYLVMEFVEGVSLGHRIEHEGRIPEEEAIRLISQVAQALHKAHRQGLVHRDVKPDNILVTADGTAKLADLGLVKELDTDLNLTRTGRGLGTPHFMAPEQFRNAKNADARCDIYSLAATLYNMVTGELPFKSAGPLDAWMKKINNDLVPARQLVPSLSERIDWAMQRAMSVDKDRRPASCREFVEDMTGHSTRRITPSAEIAAVDVWYLYYTDDQNVTHTVRGTLQGIRRSLKEGVLGDASNIRAARTKTGPFELLRNHPEFRDVVLTAQDPPPAQAKATQAAKSPPPARLQPSAKQKEQPAREPTPAPPPRTTKTSAPARAVQPLTNGQAAPAVGAAMLAPHIQFTTSSRSFPWWRLFTFLLFGGSLAAAAYYLLPHLPR